MARMTEGGGNEGGRIGADGGQRDACTLCCAPLKLSSCFKENRYGLGNFLHILRNACDNANLVATEKRHRIDGCT